ncbi:MAG: hypothetical protein ACYTDY_13475, partial [Planctomycetota bacterium]
MSLYLSLFLVLSCTSLLAQEPPAPDAQIQSDLKRIGHEATSPLERGLAISRLLAGREPAALSGLREILASEARPLEIRWAVATGVIDDPRLVLLDDLLSLIRSVPEGDFAKGAEELFLGD